MLVSMLWQLLFNMTDSSGNDEDITNAKTEMTKLVQGLEKFFKNYLVWKSDKTTNPKTGRPLVAVPQGGHITFNGGGPAGDGYFRAPVEVESGYAADCTTWGVGVLGVDFIDGAFGDGTAYDLWQTTKLLTGYFDNATGDLGGIAYTNYGCSNKTNGEFFEDCDHSYWSAEWTFGAINMCERAATEYESKGNSDYAAEMRADAESMRKTIKRPMTRGPGLEWTGGGLVQEDGSYLYSNKRFFIPWGWYANPVGALCSSSWAVLDEFKYNPFVLGGGVKSPIPDPTTEQLRAHAEHHKKLFGEEPGFEY